MNLVNNLKNFLYDKNYFISIFDNSLHLYGYEKIVKFSSSELIFVFDGFNIHVKGDGFLVKKMLNNEVLISGNIKNFEIINYEKSMD